MSEIAPGWYDDPSHAGRKRYWGGDDWTEWVSGAGGVSERFPLGPPPSGANAVALAPAQTAATTAPPATPPVPAAPVAVEVHHHVAPADAPFGRDPATGQPLSDKSKVAAGLLQFFFGMFGAGRFYMCSTGVAVVQLGLTMLGFLTFLLIIGDVILLGVAVWAFVDAVTILCGSPRDRAGRLLR